MGQSLRVLITGGSGFIGANLARTEVRAGNEVHLLLRDEARLWRLADIQGHYIPQRGDLRDADAVRRAVNTARPDVIYHLATNGAYPGQSERGTILATNLIGTINILEALAGRDYQALVNTGSSSEYGHKDAPMRPGDLLEPRTDYGVTKAAATLLCQAEAYKGAPVCTVRVFSAYGPWEEPERLVPYVLDACLQGMQAKVSVASQPRDFVYVDDVVDLMRLAAREPKCRGHILHAGTGVQSTVGDMVRVIHEVCGGPTPQFGAIAPRPDQPQHWVASVQETSVLTDWTPHYNLRAGVTRMKQWWFESYGRSKQAA